MFVFIHNTNAITTHACASEVSLNTACSKRNERYSSLQQNPQTNLTHHELHSPLARVGGDEFTGKHLLPKVISKKFNNMVHEMNVSTNEISVQHFIRC